MEDLSRDDRLKREQAEHDRWMAETVASVRRLMDARDPVEHHEFRPQTEFPRSCRRCGRFAIDERHGEAR